MKIFTLIIMLAIILFATAPLAYAAEEYRLTLMVAYPTATQRDAAVEALKVKITAAGNAIVDKTSGAVRAEINKDQYILPTPVVTGAELIKTGQ